MEEYTKLVTDILEEAIEDRMRDYEETRAEAIEHFEDNGFDNLFGNMDGSRTCSTYEARKMLDDSGALWDEEIIDLFNELGDDYFAESVKRGPETLDVIICELLGMRVLSELSAEEAA